MATSSELLSASQADADARDRELMNLKMEVAHLRERLLMRVGGDTTAAELEQENFSLKTGLMDAQESLASSQRALATLNAKYAKALSNLGKMDVAWKSSAAQLQRQTRESNAKDETLAKLQEELEQQKQRHDAELAKRQTLVSYQQEKMDAYEVASKRKDEELRQHADQQQRLTLKLKELESELTAVRERYESGEKQAKSVAKSEFEVLQTQLQEAKESFAMLRGETNALREERGSLQQQLSETKASLTAAMAKFLQLKEDNATLEVRVAAANEKSEQCKKDAAFYKSEVDRIQTELSKRDEELLQLERTTQVLELKLTQQQKLTQDAVQVRGHEAKRLELKQELTWKDKEFELEKEVRTLKQQYEAAQADTAAMRQLDEELCKMLAPTDGGEEAFPGQDLKTLVSQALARNTEAAFSVQQQQRQVARLEKELAKMKALEDENATLKAEYEKTRTAMERIVGRKTKATSNSQRFTTTAATAPATQTSTATSRASSFTSTATPATVSASASATSSMSTSFITQRRTTIDKFTSASNTLSGSSSSLVGTKRKLVLPSTSDSHPKPTTTTATGTGASGTDSSTPSSDGPFSPRTRRLVHVASRYLQATKNPKR